MAKKILNHLKVFLKNQPGATYDDGWNSVFGNSAIAGEVLTTKEERTAFWDSEDGAEVTALLNSLPKSGNMAKFPLRLPSSLYESLKREADREGVSINTLCVAKLSASLADQLR